MSEAVRPVAGVHLSVAEAVLQTASSGVRRGRPRAGEPKNDKCFWLSGKKVFGAGAWPEKGVKGVKPVTNLNLGKPEPGNWKHPRQLGGFAFHTPKLCRNRAACLCSSRTPRNDAQLRAIGTHAALFVAVHATFSAVARSRQISCACFVPAYHDIIVAWRWHLATVVHPATQLFIF